MFFTIDAENSIAAHDGTPIEALESDARTFTTLEGLDAATAEGGAARLVEIWNGFAGVAGQFANLKPVKRFMDRKTGLRRIWSALQLLAPEAIEASVQAPAPVAGLAAPKAKKGKGAKNADNPKQPRERTKRKTDAQPAKPADAGKTTAKDTVLAMIRKKGGASLDEIVTATGWQKHTVRGFISVVPGKAGLTVTSSKGEGRGRVYEAQ